MGIEDFIARNEPQKKRSKLMPFIENIRRLDELGFSQSQIVQYLSEEEGVNVTQATLSRFMVKHISDSHSNPAKPAKEQSREKSQNGKPAPSIFEKKKKAEVDLDDLLNED